MAHFSQFLESIYRDAEDQPDVERFKGIQFERFVKWFLTHDPEWKTQVDKVWLWEEYPKRWGNKKDLGTDLIFKHKNGELWAVQAKCYAQHNEISYDHVNSFLTDSDRKSISRRLLISSTDRIASNAKEVISRKKGEKPVILFMREHFEQAEINYPSDYKDLRKVKKKDKPSARPHQAAAITDVVKKFKKADRGQLIMACGTGKTFTTLWIKEKMKSKNTLVLLPSLNLLAQTVREWAFASKSQLDVLCVCSDKSVGRKKDDDDAVQSVSDVPFPVHSDVSEIRKFMRGTGDKVIFSTYQSSELVAEAQKGRVPPFDLVVADEAHRCATSGKQDSPFRIVLDGKKIKASKRLFATATPRTYTTKVKKAAEERGVEVDGMDDENKFGKPFHTLTFGEAIKNGPPLLTDYQVVIVGVDNKMVSEWIESRELVATETGEVITDAESLAAQIGLIKAMKDYNLKRVISFHSRVDRAEGFSNDIHGAIGIIKKRHRPKGELKADYVSGKMSTSDRGDKLKSLKSIGKNEIGLLSNARCLSEGVDVPSLDGVAFVDPKNSQVDIIQAVGRAIRLSDEKNIGTIVLPVFIEDGEDPEERIEASNFKPVWWVLDALKSHDDVLVDELDAIRTEMGKRGRSTAKKASLSKIEINLPVSVGRAFAGALKTRLVEQTTASWHFWFGLLVRYVEHNGTAISLVSDMKLDGYNLGNWANLQRSRKGKLTSEQILLLEEVTGWVWGKHEYQWQQGYKYLSEYYQANGNVNIASDFVTEDNYKLGSWLAQQRVKLRDNKLDQTKQASLVTMGVKVAIKEGERWKQMFKELVIFKGRFGHCDVSSRYIEQDNLGSWFSDQKKLQKKGELDGERERLLSEAGVKWSTRYSGERHWRNMIDALKDYIERYGDTIVPSDFPENQALGNWVANLRKRYRENKLPDPKVTELLRLQFVFDLSVLDGGSGSLKKARKRKKLKRNFEENVDRLLSYKERFGDCIVPSNWKEDTQLASQVGRWRNEYSKGVLKPEIISRLNEVGIDWKPNENIWERRFAELKLYISEYGDANVSPKFREVDGLARWVIKQRERWRNGLLEDDKCDRLLSVGFVFDPHNEEWDVMFNAMSDFFDTHKHFVVPRDTKPNKRLATWMVRQRKLHKEDKLEKERVERLSAIGFVWDKAEAFWEERFDELVKFKEKTGHCRVPRDYAESPSLGNWTRNLKRLDQEIAPDRYDRLSKLGFYGPPEN